MVITATPSIPTSIVTLRVAIFQLPCGVVRAIEEKEKKKKGSNKEVW